MPATIQLQLKWTAKMINFQFLVNCCLLGKCSVNSLSFFSLPVAMQVHWIFITYKHKYRELCLNLLRYRRRRREAGWHICNWYLSISGPDLHSYCWFSFRPHCYRQVQVQTSDPLLASISSVLVWTNMQDSYSTAACLTGSLKKHETTWSAFGNGGKENVNTINRLKHTKLLDASRLNTDIRESRKWIGFVCWQTLVRTNSHPAGTVTLTWFVVKSSSNSPMR